MTSQPPLAASHDNSDDNGDGGMSIERLITALGRLMLTGFTTATPTVDHPHPVAWRHDTTWRYAVDLPGIVALDLHRSHYALSRALGCDPAYVNFTHVKDQPDQWIFYITDPDPTPNPNDGPDTQACP